MRTEKKVITAATRSSPECRASESNPRLPVTIPITSLIPVKKIAANTESPATFCFSLVIVNNTKYEYIEYVT